MTMRPRPALLALLIAMHFGADSATLPPGFSETAVGTGLANPTAMALAPDGRIFVCQQGGALRVIKDGVTLPAPFVTVTVDSQGERGLLGVAFDPDFLVNRYVYVYYTSPTPTLHNRISRFTAAGDVAEPDSEVVLLELNDLSASNHNGGAIHFGRDGKLYAAVGENAVRSNSQTLDNVLGKMLRINSDGTIPPDNPFYGSATGNNRAIWALGLRNPFTFGVHPLTGRIFINDVGGTQWEEINDGVAAGNYGWPDSEGPGTPPPYNAPLHSYPNANALECAIAGGAFYAPEVRQFPASFVDSYFFSDLCGGWIRTLDTALQSSGFATGIGNPVDLLVGQDGSLHYLSRAAGSVMRVRWDRHGEGDVNGDGDTNGADVFYLIHHLRGGGPPPVAGGDVDGDGSVTAGDLSYLAAYVYGRGPGPV